MKWCADSGRFHFHKDTCCSMEQIRAKLAAIGVAGGGSSASPFRFYNANVETLLPSVLAGADGFSGISANFYPHLHSWLIDAATGSKPADEDKIRRVQDFLTLSEATVCVGYPASAKAFLRAGMPGGGLMVNTRCRALGADGQPKGASPFLEHQLEALAAMWRVQRDMCADLGIPCPQPPSR